MYRVSGQFSPSRETGQEGELPDAVMLNRLQEKKNLIQPVTTYI